MEQQAFDQWAIFEELDDLITRDNALDVAFEFYPTNRAFAEALSGTTDTKSRAYKAAMRNVERWRRGRQPRASTLDKIAALLRREEGAWEIALDQANYAGFEIDVDGEITVSEDTRERSIHTSLNLNDLSKIARIRAFGENQRQEIGMVVMRAYGIAVDAIAIASDAEITGEAHRG
jgi:hypothetical protein